MLELDELEEIIKQYALMKRAAKSGSISLAAFPKQVSAVCYYQYLEKFLKCFAPLAVTFVILSHRI